jgi:hypothetical protein
MFQLQSGRLPRNRDNGPQYRSFPQTAFRKLLQEKDLVLTSAERARMIFEAEIDAVQAWNLTSLPAMLCREA